MEESELIDSHIKANMITRQRLITVSSYMLESHIPDSEKENKGQSKKIVENKTPSFDNLSKENRKIRNEMFRFIDTFTKEDYYCYITSEGLHKEDKAVIETLMERHENFRCTISLYQRAYEKLGKDNQKFWIFLIEDEKKNKEEEEKMYELIKKNIKENTSAIIAETTNKNIFFYITGQQEFLTKFYHLLMEADKDFKSRIETYQDEYEKLGRDNEKFWSFLLEQ